MARGEVKWFNSAKGWGFIIPEAEGEDVFVHFSSVHGAGYKTLVPRQKVTYDVRNGEKGLHASSVVALSKCAETEIA